MVNEFERTSIRARIGMFLKSRYGLFHVMVTIPTLLAVIYYTFIAADIYTSESRFIVKAPGKPVPSGFASLLVGGDLGGSSDVSAVREFATSRDALAALQRGGKIEEIYNRPEADLFSRLSSGIGKSSFEDLYEYYQTRITIENVNKSSVTLLKTQAFRPEDARWINEQLLEQSEALVNRLNERSRADTVSYAEKEVAEARARSNAAAVALAGFRNANGIIDPDKQALVSMQMISKLQDELIAANTLLAQTRRLAPKNPQIEAYEARAAAIQQEIKRQTQLLAGGQESLAGKATEYARLSLESQFADKLLTAAMASLENASTEARRQQVYIERVAQPNAPDDATRPRRLRGIVAVLSMALVAWGVVTLLLAALREHKM